MNNQPSSEPVVQASTPAPRPVNRRSTLRRRARGSSKSICRKGTLGLGPNIALTLLDVSETGARLRVKEPLRVGQEVEVGLLAMGYVREFKLTGRVVWTVPDAEGGHCVGIQF